MYNEKTFDVAFERKLSIYKLSVYVQGSNIRANLQYSDYKKKKNTRKKTINHFTSLSPSYRKEKKAFHSLIGSLFNLFEVIIFILQHILISSSGETSTMIVISHFLSV